MLVSVLVARVVHEVHGRLLVPEGEAIQATAPGHGGSASTVWADSLECI